MGSRYLGGRWPGVCIMMVKRMTPSGGWMVSAMIGGYLVSRRYFGYSKREAIAKFKDETKGAKRD